MLNRLNKKRSMFLWNTAEDVYKAAWIYSIGKYLKNVVKYNAWVNILSYYPTFSDKHLVWIVFKRFGSFRLFTHTVLKYTLNGHK